MNHQNIIPTEQLIHDVNELYKSIHGICSGFYVITFILTIVYLSYRPALVSAPSSEIISSITRNEKALNHLINEFKTFKTDYTQAIKSNNLKETCVCNLDE